MISRSIPRAALVTGGARRLGRAIALALAEAGFDVAVQYRDSLDQAAATAEEIRGFGRRACTLHADLSDEPQVVSLVERAAGQLGPVGVLVNNASHFARDEWHDATKQGWDAHLAPNLRAPFVLSQDLARSLPRDAQGAILNLIDQRVWALTPHFVSYTVSKAALWSLTQSLALALAPRIRVNAIGPGPALASARQTPEQFARQCASVPLGHGTSPEEIAQAAIALLSLPSVTGQMLALDGGQHLQWHPAPPFGGPSED